MKILAVDVGGTHVKILASGETEPRKFDSGPDLTAERMVEQVKALAADWSYDRVTVGYPGPLLHDRPVAEPHNLAPGWVGFDFAGAFAKPVRVMNDAAMQALGSYRGGKMLFLGLGTGLGSTLIVDGIVEPMEIGHLPYRKATYEDYVGLRGLEGHGKKKWRDYVADVVERLVAALEPDDVVLGGGNAKHLKGLPAGCRLGDNANAFAGGFRVWEGDAAAGGPRPSGVGGPEATGPAEASPGAPSPASAAETRARQRRKIATQCGFVAALDQSGGSTPKALLAYGIEEGAWSTEAEMFDLVHRMRARIVTSPSFGGDRVFGAILFEGTMDREIEGVPTADYLWGHKRVVPFLKVDQGLEGEADGVRLMKPIPGLDDLLARANGKGIFGTKMRSVIAKANAAGIAAIVEQQMGLAGRILDAGLMPIVEPEVDIHCPDKAQAEALLLAALVESLEGLPADRQVMLKLTLPERDDLYAGLVAHPRVLKVVALSGGYTREEGNARLRRNRGVVASFSRALVEGLSAGQSDLDFDAALDASIQSIYEASLT